MYRMNTRDNWLGTFWLSLSFLVQWSHCQSTVFPREEFVFLGSDRWHDKEKQFCVQPEPEVVAKDLFCAWKVSKKNLMSIKVEVVDFDPMILLFRQLATPKQCSDIVEYAKSNGHWKSGMIYVDNKETLTYNNVVNDTTMGLDGWVYRTAQQLEERFQTITGIDLTHAEGFKTKSYIRGGHHRPHVDTPLRDIGLPERLAGLLFSLQKADEGGSTIFPLLGHRVSPEVGDALLFFLIKADGSGQDLSRHAGCPVVHGEKIVTVIFIEEEGQELRVKCPVDNLDFDFSSFALGELSAFDNLP